MSNPNPTLTVHERMNYLTRGRAHKVYEACIGQVLYATERTEKAARAAAVDQALLMASRVHQTRAYRCEQEHTTYFVHPSYSGGFAVQLLRDERLSEQGTSDWCSWQMNPDMSFAEVCEHVERHIDDIVHPTAWAKCSTCGEITFAKNKVDPIPDRCSNPACRASLVEVAVRSTDNDQA